jgi:phosphoribosylformylglycinamidine cyclo-ligase
VLPPHLSAEVDRATWSPAPVFGLLAAAGDVAPDQQELTFNQGVGMIAVVPADRQSEALAIAQRRGVRAWLIGRVTPGSGTVSMAGAHSA